MSLEGILSYEGDVIYLKGDVHFNNVVSLFESVIPYLQNRKSSIVDFSQVTDCNSAGIALIIECLKYATRHYQRLAFRNIPATLRAIIDTSDLCHLIPIEDVH